MRRFPVSAASSTSTSHLGRRDQSPRRRRVGLDPLFDQLEVRELMAASLLPEGLSMRTALPIALQALQVESVDNMFGAGIKTDYWKVNLNKGDFLGLELKTPDPSKVGQIKILDANRNVVASSISGPDSSLVFDAKVTGTYFVQVNDKSPGGKPADDILKVQQFAVNTGKTLPASPNDGTDHRWSWVSGNTLFITDSSGTGFGIKANWKKTVTVDPATGQKEANYAASGTMTIDVKVPVMVQGADGKMTPTGAMINDPITLTGTMDVKTNPGIWGAKVGTIASTDLTSLKSSKPTTPSGGVQAQSITSRGTVHTGAASTGPSLNATTLLNTFSSMYGVNATGSGANFGFDKGSNLGYLGAPLNPNESYFFATYSTGPSASFGGVSASASGASSFTLIIDPADPFVYVNVGPVTFGGSVKGLIPYQPSATNYAGPTFNGNLYAKVTGVQLGDLPVSLDGSATISLDPNNTGHPLGTSGNAASFFTTAGIKTAFSNIAVGVNGTANFGYSTGGVDISIPIGTASAGYLPSNTTEQLQIKPGLATVLYTLLPAVVNPTDFLFNLEKTFNAGLYNDVYIVKANYSFGVAGMSTNPLAGTFLESAFTGNQFAISANATGSSSSDLLNNLTVSAREMSSGGIKLLGYQLGQGESVGLTVNHDALTLDASIGVFIGQINIRGTVNFHNGGFLITGSLDKSDFPVSQFLNTTSGSLALSYNTPGYDNGLKAIVNIGFDHTIDVHLPDVTILDHKFSGADLGNFGASGNIGGSITIDTTNSTYGGTLYASASLTAFSKTFGGSVSVSLNGKTLTVHTPVPYLGDISFDI